MTIDSFMFFNELDIAEIRFNELYEYIDQFLIVEIPITHQGREKPLIFTDVLKERRFSRFKKKITLLTATMKEIEQVRYNPRKVENYQRNLIWEQVRHLEDDTIFIHGDVDEIPKAEAIQWFISSTLDGVVLRSRMYCYFYNLYFQTWPSLFITRMSNEELRTVECLAHFREKVVNRTWPQVIDAGWHFSSVGDLDFVVEKLRSIRVDPSISRKFPNIDKEYVKKRIRERRFAFNNDKPSGEVCDVDELPEFIKDNLHKFDNLILKEIDNA